MNVFANPDRDTLFILGGGSSINALTSRNLGTISTSNTVGVNFWFLHRLIPTIYSLDSGRQRSQSEAEQQAARLVEGLLGREEIVTANPLILLLRPPDATWESVMTIPEILKKNVIVGGRANSVSRRRSNLRRDLALLALAVRFRLVPPSVLPDNGASVVRLIFLAIAQRFKNIVLLGVDLDDQPHFFASPTYRDLQGPLAALFPRVPQEPHGTTDTENRPFSTVDFISDLASVVDALGLATIWVGSESSALSKTLRVYDWGDD